MAIQQGVMTAAEFWDYIARPENADRKLELIDGRIVETVPTWKHGKSALKIGALLLTFVESADLGDVAVEVDHYKPNDRHNTRRPDISFISKVRLAAIDRDAFVPTMPDLAIEIRSESNTSQEMRDKAEYYLKNGSRLVWWFDSEAQTATVYALAADGDLEMRTLGVDETLDGGAVLPGFALPLSDIFKK